MNRLIAEVNLAAIRHNVTQIRSLLGFRVDVLGVVKADGYGHGICEVANAVVKAGTDWLGVASATEGIQLRKLFPGAKICILSPFGREEAEDIVLNRLIPVVGDSESALEVAKIAQRLRSGVKVHMEVDTGMGRSGVLPDEAVKLAARIERMSSIQITGLMTHFPSPDIDPAYTMQELAIFLKTRDAIIAEGIHLETVHAACSVPLLRYPATRLNMVRPGLLIYGIIPNLPSDVVTPELIPALTLKSHIVMLRRLPAGSTIGYGRTCLLDRQSVIATIPVGYGDGYPRSLGNRGHMLIAGKRAPIVGRVCMDVSMVDVTEIPEAVVDSEVIIIGTQGKEIITAAEIARLVPTTEHDITTRLTPRVKKVYISA